jgi:hypothetical protein
MHIEYEITEQDFFNAQRLAIKNSPIVLVRLTRWILPLFGLAGIGFIVHATFQLGFSWQLIPGLAFCSFFVSIPWLSKRTQKKLYKSTPSFHGKLSLEVADDGLAFAGPSFSSKVNWSHFRRFFEDEHSFIIYQQSGTVFNILPKRTLTPEQITELRDFLARGIPSQQ